jgi:dolichyl-phosphate beta-glucosyltransferase
MSHHLTRYYLMIKKNRYVAGIKCAVDTQCGFKLFSRSAALVLFLNLNSDRWCFDIDILHMCQSLNIPVVEEDVNWSEKEGSKLTLWGMATTARDLFLVRLYYIFGFWKINTQPTI